MVSLNPFKWGRAKEPSQFRQNILTEVSGNWSRNQQGLSEEMRKTANFVSLEMFHDDKLTSALWEMYVRTQDPFYLGLVMRCSHTVAVRYIDPYIAETYKLSNENDVLEYECVMPDDDWDAGNHFAIKSASLFISHSLDDAKRGHKAIIVKSETSHLRVGFAPQEKESREGY
jgi:hypothetical protein